MAAELQEILQMVAQPLEAKVIGVAKPPPWVVELLQLWMGGLAQPPWDAPAWRMPAKHLAGYTSVGQ